TLTPTTEPHRRGPCARRGSVEAELVALDVLYHDARVVAAVVQQPYADGAERDQARALGLERGQQLLAQEPGADPHVEVHPVLDDLALRDALEEQPRPHARRVRAREPRSPVLGGPGAVEL